MYDPLNSNGVKEHEAVAISYAHAQRNASNTVKLVEVFEKLGEEDCSATAKDAHD